MTALAVEKQCEEEKEALEAITNLVHPPTVDEDEVLELQDSVGSNDEDTEVLELLLSVKFGPSLMTAMNQDPYFVHALQDPMLMTSMHQVHIPSVHLHLSTGWLTESFMFAAHGQPDRLCDFDSTAATSRPRLFPEANRAVMYVELMLAALSCWRYSKGFGVRSFKQLQCRSRAMKNEAKQYCGAVWLDA